MSFVIDTTGDQEDKNKTQGSALLKELFSKYNDSFSKEKPLQNRKEGNDLVNEILTDLRRENVRKPKCKNLLVKESSSKEVQEALKKSIITPEFEKLHSIPPFNISEKKLKQQRKRESRKTKGKKWYGLPATEKTEEVKRDLQVLQMRSVLDPKHFYKKNDLKVLPKYFQIGKVINSPLDYYNNRLTKKEQKKTLVDELLADAEFHKYNKRKYKEIIEEKQKTHYKAWRQAKRLKKKK